MSSHLVLRRTVLAAIVSFSVVACAASMPRIDQVRVPVPIQNNSGKYMSPYTLDGTVAPWVRKARVAQSGAAVGSFVGREGGERLVKSIPVFGSLFGERIGNSIGREVALRMVGGEAALRQGSDLSFSTADDLAVYLFAFQPSTEEERTLKAKVVELTQTIYPDVANVWEKAVRRAKLPAAPASSASSTTAARAQEGAPQ